MENHELTILEEKIEKLVRYCVQLRDENSDLHSSLDEKSAEIDSLQEKLREYDEMRQDVKGRINRLVQTIEELDSSSVSMDDENSVMHEQPDLLPTEPGGE